MGAVNFAVENASKTYAVLTNYEETIYTCQECEHVYYEEVDECEWCDCTEITKDEQTRVPDEFDIECLQDDINHRLKENFKDDFKSIEESISDRSYPTTLFGEVVIDKSYGDVEFKFAIKVGYTAAYYDGASLDWFLYDELESREPIGWDEIDDRVDDTFEEGVYQGYVSEGLATIHKRYAKDFLNSRIEEIIEEVEKIFEKVSTPLNRVGIMSNGVAIYEKA